MVWRRSGVKGRFSQILFAFGIIILVFAYFMHLPILYFAAVLITFFGYISPKYIDVVTSRLVLENSLEKIKLYAGEEGELALTFKNLSRLPLTHLTVSMQFDTDHLQFGAVDGNESSHNGTFTFRTAVNGRGISRMTVPFLAVKRGVAKPNSIIIEVSDPLGLHSEKFVHDLPVKKQIIIYPEEKMPIGFRELVMNREGDLINQSSIFRNQSMTAGTREYEMGDPFRNIHWKATAKKGALQTKIFEKTTAMNWTFVICLDPQANKSGREWLEDQLSRIAFLSSYAARHQIDCEFFINIKPFGRRKTFHLQAGGGRHQHARALEYLAYIKLNTIKTAVGSALQEVTHSLKQPGFIFLVHQNADIQYSEYARKWTTAGFNVCRMTDSGVIRPYQEGGGIHEAKTSFLS